MEANKVHEMFKVMTDTVENANTLCLNELDAKNTVIFSIDINNGFAKKGALYSDNVAALLPSTVKLLSNAADMGIKVVAFSDCHDEKSLELKAYPAHCMNDSEECQLPAELGFLTAVPKNSTNAFSNLDMSLIREGKTYVVTGCCTDICVYQFAVTLRAFLNEHNIDSAVIVPVNYVATFDAPGHDAEFLSTVYLYGMASNGIKLCRLEDK